MKIWLLALKSFIRFPGSGAETTADLEDGQSPVLPWEKQGVDNHLPCALGLPEPASVNLHNNPVKAGIIITLYAKSQKD